MRGASFRSANCVDANFGGASIAGTDFLGAELCRAARQTGTNEKASEERARVGAKLCSSPDINTNVCAEFDVPFMTGTPINMDTAGMDMTG